MESVRNVQVRLFLGVLVGIAGGMFVADALPLVIWWFAIPIGGVLGGAMFAAPEVRKAAPVAAQSAWQSLTYAPVYWEQYKHVSLETRRRWQIKAVFALTVLVYMGAWVATIVMLRERAGWNSIGTHVFTLVLALMLIAYSGLALPYGDGTTDGLIGSKSSKRRLLIATPLGFPAFFAILLFYLLSRIVRGAVYAWKATPKAMRVARRTLRDAAKFAVRFATELFWQVNSQPLWITMIGAGAGVGVFFPLFRVMWQWEILLATVTGALLGAGASLVYYEFVSKRILRVRT